MRTSLILLYLVSFSLCNLRTSTPEYDSLVLAIQWPNGVCAKQTSTCKQKLAKMKPNMDYGQILKVEKCFQLAIKEKQFM